ncbi:MAG: hypothetical protein ACYC75_01180 [Minisyncoccota bacterium]
MKPWFERKRYGWGLRPATWQGWTMLVGFVALVILNAMRLDVHSHSASDTIRPFVIETVIMAVIFIATAYSIGEKPLRWQWGKKDENR